MKISKIILPILLLSFLFVGCESREDKAAREAKEKQEALQIQQKEDSLKEAKRIKDLLGDEIPCVVRTIGRESGVLYNEENSNIENIKTYINRTTGTLRIHFDYKLSRAYVPIRKYLIGLFDKNDQLLTSFVTLEYYVTSNDFDNAPKESGGSIKIFKLRKVDNKFAYPMNLRDAAYVASVEIGAIAPGEN
jgi:hypothetical protein